MFKSVATRAPDGLVAPTEVIVFVPTFESTNNRVTMG